MTVTGPAWPSTAALKAALAAVQTDKVLAWGQGGKNGLQQLQAFKAAGLACPDFTSNLTEAQRWVRGGVQVFGRRLHHTQGADIVGSGPAKRWNQKWLHRDFWVAVIPSVAEYRQHVWDDRAIRVGKKAQTGQTWRKLPVRSRNNGWTLDYGWRSDSDALTEALRNLAKGACKALGYVGGAVDILKGQDGRLYVLEVNSAPSLRDANTLAAYKKAIERWVKKGKQKT